MGIYRGAGGTGDAVADSSSEALLVRELAIEVQADADAAAASAAAALVSEDNAETAATNASSSATAAASSATNAASSASAAAGSASAASTSATNAATSATAAQTAETNAETAETNAAASASAASASASTATTQATNASNSASAAATSATNASNSASAAATSATNAASSATAAAGSATTATTQASNASASASNAATSATSAAGSATTATTQAGIATTQAGLASTSASNAATSETNAAASAATATTQAGIATTQATNAASSASSAGTSATNAAASAAAAAASYDSFDDRYLGVKTAAPTLDNDGNALVTGALYYNDGTVTSGDKGMWVYDGSAWIAASAASTAILTVFKYTATAGQTTFTGADDNSLTLTYTAGSAIITVNGAVMEVGTDVTATSGTSIVLAQAALVNDEVNIYAFATFNLANVYTKAESDLNYLPKVNPSYTGTLTGGTGVVNLGSGQFYKDTNGRVLIGTTTGVGNELVSIRFNSSTSFPQGLNMVDANASASGAAFQVFRKSDDTYLGNIRRNSTDNAIYMGGNSYLALGSGDTERMRIDSSGNVGIGTSSPSAYTNYTTVTQNGTSGVEYDFKIGGTLAGYIELSSTLFKFSAESTRYFQWVTNGAERMRINSSGDVGIGTTSPATKLDVAGVVTAQAGFQTTGAGLGFSAGKWMVQYEGSSTVRSYACGADTSTYGTWAHYSAYSNGTPTIAFAATGSLLQWYTNSAERMRIDSSGNLLVGTTSGAQQLVVQGDASGCCALKVSVNGTGGIDWYNASGTYVTSVVVNASTIVYGTVSDYRLKENIAPMTGALDTVSALKPVTYNWKVDGSSGQGFIAHELQAVVPECVTGKKDAVDKDGKPKYQGIDTSFLVATLTAAIQELNAKVDAQAIELAALKGIN